MNVQELLRAHVIKVPPDASVREMVDLFDLYQVLVLPVVDEDDHLLGAVYEDQVCLALFVDGVDTLRDSLLRDGVIQRVDALRAQDLMADPVAADEHEDVFHTLAVMCETGLTRLPVTCSGKVIGTISRVDICQALLGREL